MCGGQYKPHRFSLRIFLNSPRTSFRLETNFLLSILFSNTVELHLSGTPIIQISLALRVHSSRILELTCLQITGYRIKYSTVLRLIQSQFRSGRNVYTQVLYMQQIVTAEHQSAVVAYFQRKIQLSGFSAYPDGSQSRLIWIRGVLLYPQSIFFPTGRGPSSGPHKIFAEFWVCEFMHTQNTPVYRQPIT